MGNHIKPGWEASGLQQCLFSSLVERSLEERSVRSSILLEGTMSGSLQFGGHSIGCKCEMTTKQDSGWNTQSGMWTQTSKTP
jgi:hypothetical protein